MATQVMASALECLPPEIIVKIYTSTKSSSDVKSLFLTSKRLYQVYEVNCHLIAKAHIFRVLRPDDYKLAIMAVESRKVNPHDEASLERFFHDYVHRNEWDIKLFRMYTAFNIAELAHTTEELVVYGTIPRSNGGRISQTCPPGPLPYYEPPEVRARKRRAYYIQETVINLFHRMPGPRQLPLLETPHEKWAEKFWAIFSPVEIDQVRTIRLYYWRYHLRNDVRSRIHSSHGEGCTCLDGEDIVTDDWYIRGDPMNPGNPRNSLPQYRDVFAELAGIRSLYLWRCRTANASSLLEEWEEFRDRDEFSWRNLGCGCHGYINQIDRLLSHAEAANSFSSPFHPDPQAISNRCLDMSITEWWEAMRPHSRITKNTFIYIDRVFYDRDAMRLLLNHIESP
ncbi:hypothetical protein F5Y04DRAFT_274997 [Hypomontagnella monticulosa]|nr:hypothetical protein F5Y04DRAFT_274997 [Hypomontagnella monticulosa]